LKWSDHKRITYAICRYYGLAEADLIADASILPDKDPDYYYVYRKGKVRRRRVRHHDSMAIRIAFNYLKQARKAYLRGEDYSIPLGRALHYIQDYTVDPTKKLWIFRYRSGRAHDERENGLKNIPVDINSVDRAKSDICYPHEFVGKVLEVGRGSNPEEIMTKASYLTSLAVKLVVNPDKPENLEENYKKALIRHVVLLMIPWLLLLIIGLEYVLISIIASIFMHKLDFSYAKWKIDMDWFRS